jgi:DNA-binding CsgD family transcriptional regulator
MCYYQIRSLTSRTFFLFGQDYFLVPTYLYSYFSEASMEQITLNPSSLPTRLDLPGEAYQTLTRREREVFALIASGQSNRQMAASLVVSPETVKTHVRHVLEKLGVARKAEIQTILRNRRYH